MDYTHKAIIGAETIKENKKDSEIEFLKLFCYSEVKMDWTVLMKLISNTCGAILKKNVLTLDNLTIVLPTGVVLDDAGTYSIDAVMKSPGPLLDKLIYYSQDEVPRKKVNYKRFDDYIAYSEAGISEDEVEIGRQQQAMGLWILEQIFNGDHFDQDLKYKGHPYQTKSYGYKPQHPGVYKKDIAMLSSFKLDKLGTEFARFIPIHIFHANHKHRINLGMSGHRVQNFVKTHEPDLTESADIECTNQERNKAQITKFIIMAIYPGMNYYTIFTPTRNGLVNTFYGSFNKELMSLVRFLFSTKQIKAAISDGLLYDYETDNAHKLNKFKSKKWMSWYFDLTTILPPMAGDLIDTTSEMHKVPVDWQNVASYSEDDYVKIIIAATDKVRDTDITFNHVTYRNGEIKAVV